MGNNVFLVRPKPIVGESLSSWRQRSGLRNGFKRYPRPKHGHQFHEPDRLPEREEQQWLIDKFALTFNELCVLTLDVSPIFLSKGGASNKKLKWVSPLGQTFSQTLAGPLCCVRCLQEDPIPYFRLSWRFSFLGYCPVHGAPMIDQCYECGEAMWPASARVTPKEWYELYQCQKCGADLRKAPEQPGSSKNSDHMCHAEIFNVLQGGSGTVSSSLDFFNALWAFCQLMIRRKSRHIWEYMPAELRVPKQDLERLDRLNSIEQFPYFLRMQIINAAYWLLGEWPTRFLEVAQAANITRSYMTQTSQTHPEWLVKVIDSDLTKVNRNGISKEQVQAAISALRKTGEDVTKIAVRRSLGVSESLEIDKHLSQRRLASRKELLLMCGKFEKALKKTPESRDQYAVLLRDYLILLLSVLNKCSVDKVCSLTSGSIHISITSTRGLSLGNDQVKSLIMRRAKELAEIYSSQIRPTWSVGLIKEDKYFLSRFGAALEGHSVRSRVAKMMRTGFPGNLWRSSDVFIYSLDEDAPLGRRALKRKRRGVCSL